MDNSQNNLTKILFSLALINSLLICMVAHLITIHSLKSTVKKYYTAQAEAEIDPEIAADLLKYENDGDIA